MNCFSRFCVELDNFWDLFQVYDSISIVYRESFDHVPSIIMSSICCYTESWWWLLQLFLITYPSSVLFLPSWRIWHNWSSFNTGYVDLPLKLRNRSVLLLQLRKVTKYIYFYERRHETLKRMLKVSMKLELKLKLWWTPFFFNLI